jgi:osmotically-inducible protein OsmY
MKQFIQVTFITLTLLISPMISNAEDNDSNRTEVKTYAHDAWITTKIKAELAKDTSIKTLAMVSVDTVNDGDVTLTGTARSQEVIDKIKMIATNTEGVHHVKNEITVKKDD